MIGIRVDVNQIIATGHIKRDIEIALCLRKMGEECIFVSADENCLSYLEPYGFQSVILNSCWDDMEGELERVQSVIKEYDITGLLVDSYVVTEKYMQELSKMTYVTYFDEMGKFGYGCQQLINGVLVPPDYSKATGKALLGPKYVSLRQEFSQLPKKVIRPELEKLFITSGGTDNYHFCVKFLETFLARSEWKEVKVTVAVGELSVDKDYLKHLYDNDDRVTVYVNATNMAQLMQDADYAVTAGGTSLYEVCAAGVCASCFVIGDNQIEIAQSFDERELVSYAGDFRENPDSTIERIMCHMMQAKNEKFRADKAEQLQKLVDGKGAWRIAEALIQAPK